MKVWENEKVLFDRDLAKLYGVETRVLNQAVSRNTKRFPPDFMFTLTRDEIMGISQIVTSCVILHKDGGQVCDATKIPHDVLPLALVA